MKCLKVLLIISVTVIPHCILGYKEQGYTKLHREKANIEVTTKPNPCAPFESKKPNFSSGQRISQAKCFEFIWELKNRDDRRKHDKACEQAKKAKGRIGVPHVLEGRNTLPGEFPHMGAVGWRTITNSWLFLCGSSLISSKFLLTAAHCSQVSSRDTRLANTVAEIVRLGDKNIIDDIDDDQIRVDKVILRFIVHPQYKSPKRYFDIALIELKSEVTFNKYMQPACLWSRNDTSELGTTFSVTGWGTVNAANPQTSPELQVAFVEIVDWDTCNGLLQPLFEENFDLQSHQLCAGVLAGGADTCQGDSGGPLQVEIQLPVTTEGSMSYIIGVTSFGIGCGEENSPGVYTRVSSFIDWIESIVWQ